MSIIKIENISFSYPQTNRTILSNCSLNVETGELVSILGPNGIGKSTLLNCVSNLLKPQQGAVYLNEKNIKEMTQKDIAKVVAYVQQIQHSAFAYSVFDYVLMGRASTIGLFQKPSEKDKEIVYEVLEKTGILHLASASITEISGGERQQAAIARAIAQNPQVIIFDEPTAHLDYGNQINMLRIINDLQKNGFAIVMTTHNPDHCLMLGGKIAILNRNGSLEVGDCDTLTEDLLNKIYKTRISLSYVESIGRIACIPNGL